MKKYYDNKRTSDRCEAIGCKYLKATECYMVVDGEDANIMTCNYQGKGNCFEETQKREIKK